MSELKEKIVMLEGSVELFNAKFSEPTKEVAHINKDISEEENIFFHESSHPSYKASISAVWKRHNTMKHKNPDHTQNMSCNKYGLSLKSHSELEQHNLWIYKAEVPTLEKEKYDQSNNSHVLSKEREGGLSI